MQKDIRSATIPLPTRPSTIRLMTWNIHGARPLLGRPDLRRVIAFVQRHAPDIVALQEIDARRCGDRLAFDVLAESLGTHRAEARMILAPEGDYGHVLLTRWPIVQSRLHDISVARREPRAALEATIETPNGRVHVVAVHLGLSLRERESQAAKLAALATCTETPTIMLGDFNDWFWHGPVQRALRETLPGRSRFRTFPASFPLFRLDRIYCRPARILQDAFVDTQARRVSDHLPVIADVDVRAVTDAVGQRDRAALNVVVPDPVSKG
jgi:endonuclease/exonuclease/phosphatase family metal-dependent hydrolase